MTGWRSLSASGAAPLTEKKARWYPQSEEDLQQTPAQTGQDQRGWRRFAPLDKRDAAEADKAVDRRRWPWVHPPAAARYGREYTDKSLLFITFLWRDAVLCGRTCFCSGRQQQQFQNAASTPAASVKIQVWTCSDYDLRPPMDRTMSSAKLPGWFLCLVGCFQVPNTTLIWRIFCQERRRCLN